MSDTKGAADTTNAQSTETQTTEVLTGAEKLYGKDATVVAETKPTEVKVEAKADEVKPTESKEGETKEAATTEAKTDTKEGEAKTPEKYTFEVDEDSLLKDEHLDKIAAYAQEQGLSQESAQKLADWQAEALKSYQNQLADSFKEQVKGWKETAQNDKEIGGQEFGRNVELAKRVVDRFATDDFKKALNETGFGNHPELLRMFARIGQNMGEDTLVLPGSQKAKTRSFEDLFYGDKS